MTTLMGFETSSMFSKFLLPPDVFFRHHVVAPYLLGASGILDVGGSLGELRKFLPRTHITTADVVPGADVVYDGEQLPFPDRSWEIVVSVDTLEHIPENRRLAFVKELVRIAKKKVVLIAPYGSPRHEQYERQLVESLITKGRSTPGYLQEHRKYGLVNEQTLTSIRKQFPTSGVNVVGSVALDRLNFSMHTLEVPFGPFNRALYYAKFLLNLLVNVWLLTKPPTVMNPSKGAASRVIITIEKP